MLTTLACTVFIASIIVFFSEELRKTFVRTLKNRKFQVLAPLLLASWFVIHHELAVLRLVISCRIGLYYVVYELAKVLPWISSPSVITARILTLFLIPTLLLGTTDCILLGIKTQTNVRHIILQICTFMWTIAAFLLMFTLSEYFF